MKNERCSTILFSSGFVPTRDTYKVYQESHRGWVEFNSIVASKLVGGIITFYDDSVMYVADQILEDVQDTISYSSRMVKTLILLLGVKKDKMSPFFQISPTLQMYTMRT